MMFQISALKMQRYNKLGGKGDAVLADKNMYVKIWDSL